MPEKSFGQNETQIRENIARIRGNIEKAREAGGFGKPVTLLAATKTVPAELINFATQECGITDIGENRVQELLSKYDSLVLDGVRVHFIGSLQKNKVRQIVDKVDMIHSVDSAALADEIEKRCAAIGKTMEVLIEVNIGEEESKSGVSPESVPPLAAHIASLPHLSLRGIMTIGPICAEEEEYLKYFRKTYQIFLDICGFLDHNRNSGIISMGMSGNYPEAIRCGSDIVRIGTSIFGSRTYPEK